MQKQSVDLIQKAGLRVTGVRCQMLELFKQHDTPLDVPFLTRELEVNKTSVYRQLESLIKSGLVEEVEFGDGKKRYELASKPHHHHLICNGCHSVSDVVLAHDLHTEELLIEKTHNFKITKHQLEFFGLCKKCQTVKS